MLQLAICDNDETDLRTLADQVGAYLSAHSELEGHICMFGSSGALRESLDAGDRYALFLLDVLMPGTDGIGIGKIIRERDENVPIIYTTSSEEYALNAFQNHAIRYLVKPIRQPELFSALDFGFSLLRSEKERIYTVKSRDGLVCIPGKKIVLVENRRRSAVYSLADGSEVQSVSIRGTFENAVSPLPEDPDFTRPHKSYYVNMRYIHTLQPGNLILDGGRQAPVSRSFYSQVNRDYLSFLAREEGRTL